MKSRLSNSLAGRDAIISQKRKPDSALHRNHLSGVFTILDMRWASSPAHVYQGRYLARHVISSIQTSPYRARHRPSLPDPRPGKSPPGPNSSPMPRPWAPKLHHYWLGPNLNSNSAPWAQNLRHFPTQHYTSPYDSEWSSAAGRWSFKLQSSRPHWSCLKPNTFSSHQ